MVVTSINNYLQKVHGSCTPWIGETAASFYRWWRGQETTLILTLPLTNWVKQGFRSSAVPWQRWPWTAAAGSTLLRAWANKAFGNKGAAQPSWRQGHERSIHPWIHKAQALEWCLRVTQNRRLRREECKLGLGKWRKDTFCSGGSGLEWPKVALHKPSSALHLLQETPTMAFKALPIRISAYFPSHTPYPVLMWPGTCQEHAFHRLACSCSCPSLWSWFLLSL